MSLKKNRSALKKLLSAGLIQKEGHDRPYREPNELDTISLMLNAKEKKSFGDFTEAQLLKMPVRISFFSDLLRKDGLYLEFETDMDRFLNVLLFCKWRKQLDPAISDKYLAEVTDLFETNEPFNEYMFTTCMHYLACQPVVEHRLRTGLQPISFRVFLDSDECTQPLVQMSRLKDWLIIRGLTVSNYLKNKNKTNETSKKRS